MKVWKNSCLEILVLLFILLYMASSVRSDEEDKDVSIIIPSWIDRIASWFWKSDAILKVEGLNMTVEGEEVRNNGFWDKLFSTTTAPTEETKLVVVVQPLWKQGLAFPLLGMDGVLVKSEPFDACNPVDLPPEEPSGLEMEIEGIESNSTEIKNFWFLIVDRDGCESEIKIRNAFDAGYNVLLLISPESETDKEENINGTLNLKIFVGKVGIDDGLHLAEDYTYPEPVVAKLRDLRPALWTDTTYKLIGIAIVAIAIITITIAATTLYMRHRKKKAAERKEKQFQESLERIIEALPVTVFEVNPMTKDMKCHICFGKFQPNDVMRTLPCHHRFHQRCIVGRVESGNTRCEVCQYQLLSPSRRNSNEKTPLLL